MQVFADTSGLFAAMVRNDVNYSRASRGLSQILRSRDDIHTTSYVLLETLALLQARVGLEAARQFEQALRPLLTVTWVGETLHERAFRRLELRGRKSLSLVDCASFVVMEQTGIDVAFAFDSHFRDEGFELFEPT